MKRQRSIQNLRLVIEYDGGGFHGWQIQKGQRTIQQVLTRAVAKATGERINVIGASASTRNDQGGDMTDRSKKAPRARGPSSRLASASPNTAPRQWPTWSGPVGLAETYSTFHVQLYLRAQTFLYPISE